MEGHYHNRDGDGNGFCAVEDGLHGFGREQKEAQRTGLDSRRDFMRVC